MIRDVGIEQKNSYDESTVLIRKAGTERVKGGYRRIVFTNGCFDILHPGHLAVLQHCREVAGPWGAVVVGLNTDDSVRRLKGEGRPIMDERARGLLLVTLKYVDHVVTFEEDTPLELIKSLKPDVVVKGGDYAADDVVGKGISLISIVDTDPDWSTSNIIQRIKLL
jgi:rfaE bifunctional protein nucleotidyltransferase chain/domain